jgi:hypothetical protein
LYAWTGIGYVVVEDLDPNLVFCGVATTVTVKINVLKKYSPMAE